MPGVFLMFTVFYRINNPKTHGAERARVAAGDFQEAIKFYRRAQQRVPLPEIAIMLGDVYTKLGMTDEAKRQRNSLSLSSGRAQVAPLTRGSWPSSGPITT